MAKRRSKPSTEVNTDITMIQASLDHQKLLFNERRDWLIEMIIESHLQIRFYSGDDEELLGDAYLYQWLEFYGKFSLPDKQKAEIMNQVIEEFPGADLDWRKERCQLIAYNKYLKVRENLDNHINE